MHKPVWGKKSISTVCSCLVTYHHSTHLARSPSRAEALNSADTGERANLVLWRVAALLTRCNKTLNDLHHKWTMFPVQQSIFD